MESFLERVAFTVRVTLRMLIPPLYSMEPLEKLCRERLAKNPTASLPRLFLANLYKDYQRNEEAKTEFLEIQRLGKLTDRIRIDLSEVLYRLKDYQGVIEILWPINDRYPSRKYANWYTGISYFELGNFGKAGMYLDRAIAAGLRRPDDYWRLGISYDRTGELQKAADAYRNALAGRPGSEDLKSNLVSVYVRLGKALIEKDPERARGELSKALALSPEDPTAVSLMKLLEGR